MSVSLKRHTTLATVEVEAINGVDGQGKPNFDTAAEIDARALREHKSVVGPNGSPVQTSLTLWVPGDASPMPAMDDRITYDGSSFIVSEYQEVRDFKNRLDHVRLRCRDE